MSEDKNVFIHHVFFWLANPKSTEDRAQLLAGLRKLSKVLTIKRFHIGRPAGTLRDVIDTSYAFSWCIFFQMLRIRRVTRQILFISGLLKNVLTYGAG